MGYTTYFDGAVEIVPPLNEQEVAYLEKFANTRRMHRKNGPYFVDGKGFAGQDREDDVIDYNRPDPSQPGLWCQWTPGVSRDAEGNEVHDRVEWDEGEKFYDATEWMRYLVDHFIGENPLAKLNNPEEFSFLQGHICNGTIHAEGEEPGDIWKIVVKDNVVTKHQAKVTYDYGDGETIEL